MCGAVDDVGGTLLFGHGLVVGVDDAGRGLGCGVECVAVVDVGGMFRRVEGMAPAVDGTFAHGAVVDGMPGICGVLAVGSGMP